MNKTLSVSAIENGTVIDHIPAGGAIKIIQLLNLMAHKNQLTIGINLRGNHGFKDLIKMEQRFLTELETKEIGIFAPNATINIIKNFKVVEKIKAVLPEAVIHIMKCPNPKCITQNEPIQTHFMLYHEHASVKVHCKYCERTFDREEVTEYVD